MKFEERVLQQEFTLNDTDDLIVDYIRKNKANLEHLSIQKVAEDLYLVPNSIMRLCKKLGYKGFAEMKFLVNNEVSENLDIQKLLSKNLYKSMELINYNLRCYDYRAEYYQTYREIEYRIKHCEEKDILFVISASGENGRLNNWVEEAKQNGIFVISVTHFNENRLGGLAHIPLYYWGDEQKLNGYNVADRTGMMMLLRELTEVFWRMYCV